MAERRQVCDIDGAPLVELAQRRVRDRRVRREVAEVDRPEVHRGSRVDRARRLHRRDSPAERRLGRRVRVVLCPPCLAQHRRHDDGEVAHNERERVLC